MPPPRLVTNDIPRVLWYVSQDITIATSPPPSHPDPGPTTIAPHGIAPTQTNKHPTQPRRVPPRRTRPRPAFPRSLHQLHVRYTLQARTDPGHNFTNACCTSSPTARSRFPPANLLAIIWPRLLRNLSHHHEEGAQGLNSKMKWRWMNRCL